MAPTAHARLSPSSAARWIRCPASIVVAGDVRTEESPYAREGTAAHALAEIEARYRLLGMGAEELNRALAEWRAEYGSDYDEAEILGYVEKYVDKVEEALDADPSAFLLLEQKMDTGVPGCWGTGDAVVVSPTNIHVLDLKYGKGVPVSSNNNPQLRLYGLAGLRTFGDLLWEVETVTTTIVQPRLHSSSTETLSVEELLAWESGTVLPAVRSIENGERDFGPSEEACRWCPIAGECRPRLEHITRRDFGDPDLLTDEEVGRELARVKETRSWCDALEKVGLRRAYSEGREIPGWKVVRTNGRRIVTNGPAAIQTLIDHGYPAEEVSKIAVKPIGELEKLLGRETFSDLLGEFVLKTEGNPALAPEADRRKPIAPAASAAEDFGSPS